MKTLRLPLAALILGCSAAFGCHAGFINDSVGGSGATTSATGTGTSTGTMSTGTDSSSASFMTGATSTGVGGGDQVSEVFGHSSDVLYRLDPDTKVVTEVAQFSGCDGSVIDIALDKNSNLIAASDSGLYAVDRMTAKCTLIQQGNYPNSLSFIPAGTLDPNEETLVGFEFDQYERIDPKTGTITKIGSPWGNGLGSSGDIVSVKDGPTYLTVTSTDNSCPTDCLVELDPQTGKMTKNWGPIPSPNGGGFNEVWGIAFWAGSVFGFDNGGDLFEVKFDNGVISTTFINAPAGVSFWGAGSTTSAPPKPVPH